MARILLSPPSSPAIGSNSYSTGKTFCLPTVRSRRFLLAAVALIIGLPLCSSWFNFNNPHESYLDRVSHASQAQMARVWQQIGTAEHDLGFDKTCEKTLLWVFSGKSGFGSEYGMFLRYVLAPVMHPACAQFDTTLRAATFAKANNCETSQRPYTSKLSFLMKLDEQTRY